jgi:hypothetical protein
MRTILAQFFGTLCFFEQRPKVTVPKLHPGEDDESIRERIEDAGPVGQPCSGMIRNEMKKRKPECAEVTSTNFAGSRRLDGMTPKT